MNHVERLRQIQQVSRKRRWSNTDKIIVRIVICGEIVEAGGSTLHLLFVFVELLVVALG
jgi:hypothetical protein